MQNFSWNIESNKFKEDEQTLKLVNGISDVCVIIVYDEICECAKSLR